MRIEEIDDRRLYYGMKDEFVVKLNSKDHKFGVAFSIEEIYRHALMRFFVEARIVADSPSEKYLHGEQNEYHNLIANCLLDVGGIPITQTLYKINDKSVPDLLSLCKGIEESQYQIEREYPFWCRKSTRDLVEICYPLFRTREAAVEFATALAKYRCDVLPLMIGSILDKKIGLGDEDGWSLLSRQIYG